MLIADDDRAIRDALTRALGLEGYDVATSMAHGAAAGGIARPDVASST